MASLCQRGHGAGLSVGRQPCTRVHTYITPAVMYTNTLVHLFISIYPYPFWLKPRFSSLLALLFLANVILSGTRASRRIRWQWLFLLGATGIHGGSTAGSMAAKGTGWRWRSSAGVAKRQQRLSPSGVPYCNLTSCLLVNRNPSIDPTGFNTNARLHVEHRTPESCDIAERSCLPDAGGNLAQGTISDVQPTFADSWEKLYTPCGPSAMLPLSRARGRAWADQEHSEDDQPNVVDLDGNAAQKTDLNPVVCEAELGAALPTIGSSDVDNDDCETKTSPDFNDKDSATSGVHATGINPDAARFQMADEDSASASVVWQLCETIEFQKQHIAHLSGQVHSLSQLMCLRILPCNDRSASGGGRINLESEHFSQVPVVSATGGCTVPLRDNTSFQVLPAEDNHDILTESIAEEQPSVIKNSLAVALSGTDRENVESYLSSCCASPRASMHSDGASFASDCFLHSDGDFFLH